LISCSPKVECNKPYILVGGSCCLDTNNNQICDKDETAPVKENPVQDTPKSEPINEIREVNPTEPTDEVKETAKVIEELKKTTDNTLSMITEGNKRLKSYKCVYTNPILNKPYTIYWKGSKIKLYSNNQLKFNSTVVYDTILFDTDKKTAEAYCLSRDAGCKMYLTKVADLDFGKAYFNLPSDWPLKITEAKKIDEITFEDRDVVRAETNIGIAYIEKYYGFVYRLENENGKWECVDITYNTLTDSDIEPAFV